MVRPASRCVLEPGYFAVPGFEVRVGSHPAATSLPRHEHELPTICCVDHGRFVEHYPGKSVSCDPRMVKVTPAGEPHWNRFDTVDTLGLRIDVDDTHFGDAPALQRLLHERLLPRRRLRWAGPSPHHGDHGAGRVRGRGGGGAAAGTAGPACPHAAASPRAHAHWLRRADEVVHERFASSLSVSSVAAPWTCTLQPSPASTGIRSAAAWANGSAASAWPPRRARSRKALTNCPAWRWTPASTTRATSAGRSAVGSA
jgi:hypothetical protein